MGIRYTSAAYRELGGMLRAVRENTGMTSEQLAERLGWSLSTVSRMENGKRMSSSIDVIQFAVLCGLKPPESKALVELARIAERDEGYYLSDKRLDSALQSLIFHETSATHSIIFEPQVIHGLLQTPDYARTLITAIHPDIAEDRVAAAIRTRMERRRILSLPQPPRFTFYLHEHALRVRIGSDEIMHETLLHLTLIAAMDNVTIRVVPRGCGARSALSGAFHLMKFHEHRPLVYLDHLGGSGLVLEDPDYVRGYRELAPILDDAALDEGQSREFAAELADAYDRGRKRRVAVNVAQEQPQRRFGDGLRGGGVAEEQPQRRGGVELRGGGVVEPPTPIYE